MSVVYSLGGTQVPYVVPGAVNLYSNYVAGSVMSTPTGGAHMAAAAASAPSSMTTSPATSTTVQLKPEPASPLSSSVFTIAPTAIPQDVFTARNLAPWLNNNGSMGAGPFTSRGVQAFNVLGSPVLPQPMMYGPSVMPTVSHLTTVVPSASPALTMAYNGVAIAGILGRPSVVGGYPVW